MEPWRCRRPSSQKAERPHGNHRHFPAHASTHKPPARCPAVSSRCAPSDRARIHADDPGPPALSQNPTGAPP